ncbi:hypothetical protein KY317_03970 [Candidatus Woesearchaeota archaeon]|nr:hypothetical protein [Candidatus Woesearchaeota archaeon]
MRKVNKLTNKNQGQITIFIIIGMLIVVVVFFLFYTVKISSVRQLEAETRRVSSSAVSSAPIQYLGNDCVKKSLKQGIIMLGKQGGWFLEGHPGYLGGPGDIGGVSYALYQETYSESWPCAESFTAPDYCRYVIPEQGVFFSHLTLPSMSQIESQLKNYIKETIPDCIDVEELIGLAANYEAKTGDIDIKKIEFGVGSIYAQVDYPIEIAVKGGNPIIYVHHLEATVEPIRFKQIYSAVRDAIEKEKQDLIYKITEQMSEELVKNGLHNTKFSYERKKKGLVFTITDPASRIDGASDYLFQFAIKNRPPVLSYISRYPDELDTYDYLVAKGEEIDINPVAIDPDDEEPGEISITPVKRNKDNKITLVWVKVPDANNPDLSDSQEVRISYGK